MIQPQGNTGVFAPALARLPRLSRPTWLLVIALVLLAAVLPGLWTLAGLVVLAVVIGIIIKPEFAVYLLTLSVPFGSIVQIGTESFSVTPTEGLMALMVIGWAARTLARRRVVIPFTPLTVPFAAMLAVVVLSGYQAINGALTMKETLKWLELVLVYAFIVAEMGTPAHVRGLLIALFAAAGLEAMVGAVQFVLGIGPEPFAIGRFMRAYGTFEQPNPFAGYLGMLIPLGVGTLLSRPSPRMQRYFMVTTGLAIAAVAMSLSRGSWMGISLGLAVMAAFWSRRSLVLLIAGATASVPVLALAFMNVLPEEITTRLATVFDYFRFIDVSKEVVTPENWALIERAAHWQAAIDMIQAYPLFGVGAGNYPAAYPQFYQQGWVEALGHAHNFYLNVAAEMGIPALIIYLSLLITAVLFTMKWLRRSSTLSPRELWIWRGILLGVLGALVTSSMHNVFDNLFVHAMSVQLGMILALGQIAATNLREQLSVIGVIQPHER